MTREDFIKTYCEGAALAPQGELVYHLIGQLYDSRQAQYRLGEMIQIMDEVALDSNILVRCKSCDKMYDLPCDLSEFNPDMSYCGGSDRCCP